MPEKTLSTNPVTEKEVINSINCLDKSPRSIKNIISGYNQMVSLGLFEPTLLANTFVPIEAFNTLVSKVKLFVKENNRNRSWPSFLNDIRAAVIKTSTIDVTNMSFSDALFALGQKKYGRITKIELARSLSKDDNRICYETTYRWILGKTIPTMTTTIKKVKDILDPLLNANGQLGSKLQYPQKKKEKSNKSLKYHIKQSERYISEVQQFISYKLDNILPKQDKPFESQVTDINLKRAYFCKPERGRSWKRTSEGIFKSEQNRNEQFSFFFSSLRNLYSDGTDMISIGDLLNDKALEEMTDLAISDEISKNTAIEVLRIAQSECEINSYLSQYYPDISNYHTFEEWNNYIEYLKIRIKQLIRNIEDVKPDKNGTKNIEFILRKDHISQLKTHKEILSSMIKHASSYETSSVSSMYSHATAAFYQISIFGCPLRCDNFCSLKWLGEIDENKEHQIKCDDKNAYIYRINNEYRIYVPKGMLKNRANKEITDISRSIEYASETISRYLEVRNIYLQSNQTTSEYFFIDSVRCGRVNRRPMSNIFSSHTLRAIQNLYPEMNHINGINPQAMRHLCATLYLATHSQDFTGLSTLLMDSLKTVLKIYAKNDHTGNSQVISDWGISLVKDNA